jgi:uncharacterized protein YutE (UPF0331/DUF86 family)
MTVDSDKIRTKLHFIREALRRLEEIRSQGREAFLADRILQAAAERNLQVGIEAILDTAGHILAREGLGLAKTHREAMDILLREGVLPVSHRESFLEMSSFRNRLVHIYDEIDPAEVFEILEKHLEDFETFIRAIVQRYVSSEKGEDA